MVKSPHHPDIIVPRLAVDVKRNFVRKWAIRRVKRSGRYKHFKVYYHAILPEVQKRYGLASRLLALDLTCRQFPETDWLRGVCAAHKHWHVLRTSYIRKKTKKLRLFSLQKAAIQWKAWVELKTLQNRRRGLERARQLRYASAITKKTEADIARIENRAAVYRMRAKLYQWHAKNYQRELERKKQLEVERIEADELAQKIAADSPESTSFLDDIIWVYSNLASLAFVDPAGNKRLNLDLVNTAPSRGAIMLSRYAVERPEAFLEKFAIKLLPKALNEAVQTGEAMAAREADPDLSSLSQFLG